MTGGPNYLNFLIFDFSAPSPLSFVNYTKKVIFVKFGLDYLTPSRASKGLNNCKKIGLF